MLQSTPCEAIPISTHFLPGSYPDLSHAPPTPIQDKDRNKDQNPTHCLQGLHSLASVSSSAYLVMLALMPQSLYATLSLQPQGCYICCHPHPIPDLCNSYLSFPKNEDCHGLFHHTPSAPKEWINGWMDGRTGEWMDE